MENRRPIEITIYPGQRFDEEKAEQTVKWIQTVAPVIMNTKHITFEMFLTGRSQISRFYLN